MEDMIVLNGMAYYSQSKITAVMATLSAAHDYYSGRSTAVSVSASDAVTNYEEFLREIDQDALSEFQEKYVKIRFGKWIGG